jgi:hypothetical protein
MPSAVNIKDTLSIDFEFNGTKEEVLNLVCASIYDNKSDILHNFWLHNSPGEKKRLVEFLNKNKDRVYLAYNASAEAGCFYSLGLDPDKFMWVDDFLEYRCLSNQNDELNYGKQLRDGKVIKTFRPPPKWERTEEDSKNSFKPTHSLAEATYKLTGEIRDTEHKKDMIDLIISCPKEFTEKEAYVIQKYCDEDVVHLAKNHNAIIALYKKYLDRDYDPVRLSKDMLNRGAYAAITGVRERRGYPIDYEKTKNFSDQVRSILDDCQREINDLFPELEVFYFKKSEQRFAMRQKNVRNWIKENVEDVKRWKLTDGGKSGKKDLSLSLDAFTQHFDYTHSYPKDNFGAQMVRFLKLKQSLNGFTPSPKKKSFWDSVGSDGRVRPYMNIFGSQSSRSQPPSTSYLLLKPAWQRSLLVPAKGKVITSIDYGSEEYFITALVYGDERMIKSYIDGDVYLAFAILSKMVPEWADKKSHPLQRQVAKSLVLGISYLMSKYGLSKKLSADTGKEYTIEDAQELIDEFYDVYSDFAEGQKDFIEEYKIYEKYCSSDGWFMWGDNDNFRSVANVPIQTCGAVIMREADLRTYRSGIYTPCTLHDALYIEHDFGDWGAIDTTIKHMREAFADEFPEKRELAMNIRLDPHTWGPGFPAPTIDEQGNKKYSTITTPDKHIIPCSDIYIDERGEQEYKQFSKYFEKREEFML